jgi:RNA polymerase sigma-70 factor (ECF subfamily)
MDAFNGFKTRFNRLTLLLRARGRRMDEAEDAVQDAYVRLLEYVKQGNEVVEPDAFLTRVAYNASVDHRRRHATRLKDSRPIEKILLPESKPGPEDVAATEQCLQQTKDLLEAALGVRVCKVFFLHCFDGFTYAEIAKQINMSVRTVEKDLVKALKVLAVADLPKPKPER